MDYAIDDKVIHPTHGAGVITGMVDVELVEGFEHYYVIEFPNQMMTVHVPTRKMEELGVRPAMRRAKIDSVLDTLRSLPHTLSDNYKARQATIRATLKKGRPTQIAKAIRDLSWRDHHKSLTQSDARLLSRARDFLAAEIALVLEVAATEANQMIDAALQDGFRAAEAA